MTQSQTTLRQFATRAEFVEFCKAENMAFLDANRKRVYLEYVRDPVPTNADGIVLDNPLVADMIARAIYRRGRPTAVLVAYRADNGDLTMGWSASHPGNAKKPPEKFNKDIGLWKAIRRATGQGRQAGQLPDRLVYGYSTDGVTANIKVDDFLERATAELQPHE